VIQSVLNRLSKADYHCGGSDQIKLVRIVHVEDFADPPRPETDTAFDPDAGEPALAPLDSLEKALKAFDDAGKSTLPVVDPKHPTEIIGYASHVKALRYFNSALIEANVEEHR